MLDKHYNCVECETTDHIIPWNVLKTRCCNFDEETIEVLMASLQKQGKAVLFLTPEGEKVCIQWGICLYLHTLPSWLKNRFRELM